METYKYRNKLSQNTIKTIQWKHQINGCNLFEKQIYQIDGNGNIVNKYNSLSEMDIIFNTKENVIRYYINNQILVGGNLFVFVKDYKTTIDYKTLIKFIKATKK
jgi:nitrogenase subunit NifH